MNGNEPENWQLFDSQQRLGPHLPAFKSDTAVKIRNFRTRFGQSVGEKLIYRSQTGHKWVKTYKCVSQRVSTGEISQLKVSARCIAYFSVSPVCNTRCTLFWKYFAEIIVVFVVIITCHDEKYFGRFLKRCENGKADPPRQLSHNACKPWSGEILIKLTDWWINSGRWL